MNGYALGISAIFVLVVAVFLIPAESTYIAVPPSAETYLFTVSNQTQLVLADPVEVTFNIHQRGEYITHDPITNNSDIVIQYPGLYQVTVQPQVAKTSGGGIQHIHFYTRTNDIDDPNSSIAMSVDKNSDTDVVILSSSNHYEAGDTINIMMTGSDTTVGLGIYSDTHAGEPTIPSIILDVVRIG